MTHAAIEWQVEYDASVRTLVPWMPAAAFLARQDGRNQANYLGMLPLRVGPPLLGPDFVDVTDPAGGFAVAFPAESPISGGFVEHEAGHGALDVAAHRRDLAEGRGTAGDDILRELAAIISPGFEWSADQLRGEYAAEAFRVAVTGSVSPARYAFPPGTRLPYPIAALRDYFINVMPVPRTGGTHMVIADPAGHLLSFPLTRGFADLSTPQYGPHTGIDLALPLGTPVPAVRAGDVVIDDDSSYYDGALPATWSGIAVWLRTDDGEEWGYCHLERNVVSVGQHIAAGEILGYSGSTGASTGPHLHLERRNIQSIPFDPYMEVLMLSKDALEQVRQVVREENAKIGATITSGFNVTMVRMLRRLARFLKGGTYDIAGVGGTGTVGYIDDDAPLA